jgi:hypothetical protein
VLVCWCAPSSADTSVRRCADGPSKSVCPHQLIHTHCPRSLSPPTTLEGPLAPLVVIACTALVGNLSFITRCMLRRTLLGLAGTVPHNTIPPVLAPRSHCPHLRQMLSVLTCPFACLTVLGPAGKSVEAEQKRINKEMANIRQKFGAFHSHFASCRGCTVCSGAPTTD